MAIENLDQKLNSKATARPPKAGEKGLEVQGSTDVGLALQGNLHSQLANLACTVGALGESSQPAVDQLADAIVDTLDVEGRLMSAVTDRLMTRQAIAAFEVNQDAFSVDVPQVKVQRSNGKIRLNIQAASVPAAQLPEGKVA